MTRQTIICLTCKCGSPSIPMQSLWFVANLYPDWQSQAKPPSRFLQTCWHPCDVVVHSSTSTRFKKYRYYNIFLFVIPISLMNSLSLFLSLSLSLSLSLPGSPSLTYHYKFSHQRLWYSQIDNHRWRIRLCYCRFFSQDDCHSCGCFLSIHLHLLHNKHY